jgi:hypothetical protein
VHDFGETYNPFMTVKGFFKALGRKLTPPGNRGSLETEYRQPNGQGTHTSSEVGTASKAHGYTGY